MVCPHPHRPCALDPEKEGWETGEKAITGGRKRRNSKKKKSPLGSQTARTRSRDFPELQSPAPSSSWCPCLRRRAALWLVSRWQEKGSWAHLSLQGCPPPNPRFALIPRCDWDQNVSDTVVISYPGSRSSRSVPPQAPPLVLARGPSWVKVSLFLPGGCLALYLLRFAQRWAFWWLPSWERCFLLSHPQQLQTTSAWSSPALMGSKVMRRTCVPWMGV